MCCYCCFKAQIAKTKLNKMLKYHVSVQNLHQIKITGTWTEFYGTKIFIEHFYFHTEFQMKISKFNVQTAVPQKTPKKHCTLYPQRSQYPVVYNVIYDSRYWFNKLTNPQQRPDPTHNNVNTVIALKLHKWLVGV